MAAYSSALVQKDTNITKLINKENNHNNKLN